jgi:hypothetical protein
MSERSKKTEIFVDQQEFDDRIREKAKESFKHKGAAWEVRSVLNRIHRGKK